MAILVACAAEPAMLPIEPRHVARRNREGRLAATDLRRDARWPEAIRATLGLWLFVFMIYLPAMVRRHGGAPLPLALDGATVIASMLIAGAIFALFRLTLGEPPVTRMAAIGSAIIVAAAAQAAFDLLLVRLLADRLAATWATMPDDLFRGYVGMLNDAAVFAVNAALFQLAFGRRRGLRQERRLAAMQAAGQRAELEALRFRLNPHFLFNTLNGISAMIVTRRLAEADEMVDRLSAFLRAALGGTVPAAVSLEQELTVVEHYARIEQLRFGERLAIELGCAGEACERTLPPLLVQQLVEQAVEAASRAAVQARITVRADLDDGRLRIMIDHPHMAMPDRHLAAARARVAEYAGAQVARVGGATRLLLPAEGEAA